MIKKLNPDDYNRARKNYLYYIKAMIYFNNNEINKAKQTLETFFNFINEEQINTIYEDINDLYLSFINE